MTHKHVLKFRFTPTAGAKAQHAREVVDYWATTPGESANKNFIDAVTLFYDLRSGNIDELITLFPWVKSMLSTSSSHSAQGQEAETSGFDQDRLSSSADGLFG
jgi:hypothetical protein